MNFNKISVEVFGTSHSEQIGVKVSGFEIGERVDLVELQKFVNRRRAVNSNFSTSRIEGDEIIITEGIKDNKISGDITAIINNTNKRSSDYDKLKYIPRPSHADYSAMLKYGIEYDLRGGGEFSGRMTAPLCIAGGIAKQILIKKGITVNAYVSQVGCVKCLSYKDRVFSNDELNRVVTNKIPVFSNENEVNALLDKCRKNKDSVGGKIECVIRGVKGGIGGELFNGIEGQISRFIFAIPSVKAVEFGLGEEFSQSFASDVNDQYQIENNKVQVLTNNNGGVLGGITTGEDILVSATFKPTPSIAKKQKSVNLKTMENVEIEINGRHDVCHTIRAVAPVEAVIALALIDLGV